MLTLARCPHEQFSNCAATPPNHPIHGFTLNGPGSPMSSIPRLHEWDVFKRHLSNCDVPPRIERRDLLGAFPRLAIDPCQRLAEGFFAGIGHAAVSFLGSISSFLAS